jgi:hypothetical protein
MDIRQLDIPRSCSTSTAADHPKSAAATTRTMRRPDDHDEWREGSIKESFCLYCWLSLTQDQSSIIEIPMATFLSFFDSNLTHDVDMEEEEEEKKRGPARGTR